MGLLDGVTYLVRMVISANLKTVMSMESPVMTTITSATDSQVTDEPLDLTGLARALQALMLDCGVSCVVWIAPERAIAPQPSAWSPWAIAPSPTPEPSFIPLKVTQPPPWLQPWLADPQPQQLTTGDLVLAVYGDEGAINAPDGKVPRLVLQVRRSPLHSAVGDESQFSVEGAIALVPQITDWEAVELAELVRHGQVLGLTYALAQERQHLAQVQRQAALIGRITHLLNANLNPDSVLGQILAELGQGYGGDRCLLLDMRNAAAVTVTADWSDLEAPTFDPTPLPSKLWDDLLELFLQDGVSYLSLQADRPDAESTAILCQALKATTVLLVPVFVQTELFGMLALVSAHAAQHYPLESLQAIHQVAEHAAIALAQIMHSHSPRSVLPDRRVEAPIYQTDPWIDTLTGLANRDALEQELSHLSHATLWPVQPSFSVLLGDIDYFKLINDTHGHEAGDEVLQEVADRLQTQLRQGTPVYRYDGEEFLIILTDATLHQAADVAERLRAAIQHPLMKTKAGPVEVTLSFGVARQDLGQDTHAQAVVTRAENALLEAKREGRNRIKVL